VHTLRHGPYRCLVLVLFMLFILQTSGVGPATAISGEASYVSDIDVPEWREASPTRVIVNSTADWGRILFDDLNGTNANGIRIKSVVRKEWIKGNDSDDQLYAGPKMPWPDIEYDRIIARRTDMVAFFKGLGDFHPTEAYADLILEVNIELPQVYVWLMTGGNGTTTFEIVSQDTGGIIWRDIVVGSGETQQVKRVMSPQPFLRPGRAESSVVVTWLSIAILIMILLNFPVPEVVREHLRRKGSARQTRHGDEHHKRKREREEGTGWR
jgi:hypothetical protein